MKTVKIYNWLDIRQPIIDGMVKWINNPPLIHKAYIMMGIPKFPRGDSDDKYVHEYITWVICNTEALDDIIDGTCFIIQYKNHKIFFDFNEVVYSCNFPESIP
jgi:hypothetical protein